MANRKIMAISSGGGHWVQLMRLKPAFDDLDVFYVGRDPSASTDVPDRRFYAIRDVSRRDAWALVPVFFQLLWILLKERPGVVVTTGALPALLSLVMAKYLLRAKTIWIDSIANVEELSTSGRLAGKVADVWLTQWPHLSTQDGPQHWGSVL